MKLLDLSPTFRSGPPPSLRREAEGGALITIAEDLSSLRKQYPTEAGQYLMIQVWNLSAHLVVWTAAPDGTANVEPLEHLIPEYMLIAAIEAAGGYINHSGLYAPGAEIEEEVRMRLMEAGGMQVCPGCETKRIEKMGTQMRRSGQRRQRWRCLECGRTWFTAYGEDVKLTPEQEEKFR